MTDVEKKQTKYYVTTFYKFFDWPVDKNINEHGEDLELWCKKEGLKGLIIVAKEGFNGTVSSTEPLGKLKQHLESLAQSSLVFKDSESMSSSSAPFKRMKIKVRPEIVTLGDTKINPSKNNYSNKVKHLPPQNWHQMLSENDSVQVIDVRNEFEYELGTFKKAQNWKMQKFTEFPELVQKKDLKKDKPVMMFCTGGIRCEKASLEMAEQGYKEVYQLEGGILNYLKEYPNQAFQGECFVFDHRVSVKQDLQPSDDYALCVHCGQPGKKEEIDCVQCGSKTQVSCKSCRDKAMKYNTCSKNCAHHFEMGHTSKKQA